ncbi:MAG: hypothetical protein DWQ40_12800, partial [Actinobacteria bacterium]
MWESRVAPLSGVVFGLLLIASYLVDPNTDFMPPPGEIVAYLENSPLLVMLGGYLRMLAAVALVWFTGTLYQSMKTVGDGRLAILAFGGGVMAASLILIGSAAIVAAAERLFVTDAIDAASATALVDLASISVGNAAPFGFAVLIGAAGIALLAAQRPNRRIGWVSVAIALGLLSPYGWVVLAATLIWV